MRMRTTGEVTVLLAKARQGDESAGVKAFELLYRDMRLIARSHLNREDPNHTLQPTALVNEVYLRFFGRRPPAFEDRAHFLAMASQAMRRLLVDHARRKQAGKRGGPFKAISLESEIAVRGEDWPRLISLNQAMERLASWDARSCQVVEMRFFGGLSEEEIAAVLGVSVRTVKRDWEHARAWLHGEMSAEAKARGSDS